jgi:predicted MFS family arabinose efflux permease
MRVFSIGPSEFSLVISSYAFSAAICGILGSLFLDRFDRKKALLFLYSGFILGTLACAFAFNHHALIFARIIAGGFGGILGGLIFSILGDNIPENRRGAATGTVMSAFGVSSVIGIPTGLFLADHFNWHAPFIFLSVLSSLVLILIIKKMRPMKQHLKESQDSKLSRWESFKTNLFEPNHLRAFTLSLFIILSGFMVIPFVSPYMVKNVGLLETELPYLYFCGGLFTLVTSRLIGKLSDKIGKHKVFYIIGSLSLIPILIITHLPKLPLPIVLLCSSLFFILVSGRFVPIMSMITSSVKPSNRGSFMSLNSAIQSIAMGIASFVAGLIISTGANGELVNYGFIGIISCLFTVFSMFLASRVKIIT